MAKNLEKGKKSAITAFLAFLLASTTISAFLLIDVDAATDSQILDVEQGPYGNWFKIQTESITILFPAGGKKPMFLWWYANDTDNIYVAKYKGLIEYITLDLPFYLRKYHADGLTIRERLQAKYGGPGPYQTRILNSIGNYLSLSLGLHPAYLPFGACQWNLTGPALTTRGDGTAYISFNFTLLRAPLAFAFADGQVVIRCRFYTTDATEDAHGLYSYTVKAGELKMDVVINNWEWNVDKLSDLFNTLHDEFGIAVPQTHGSLALWVDLSSIGLTNLPLAEQDASSAVDILEGQSHASDMIVGGQRVQIRANATQQGADETPITLRERIRERYRLRFASGSQTLAGFFDFVDKAVVINSTTQEKTLIDVTGAFIAAGAHMRLFICYPYFGSNILEHDPTIGVESISYWIPTSLLAVLVGGTLIIAVALAAMRIRRKTVNIISLP